MARLLRTALDAAGLAVRHAETGAEGLEAAKTHAPDIILLDLHMPDLHGFEVLARLRARPESPPTVVITADGKLDTAVRAMREGAIDFIVKPFSAAKVVRTVCQALDSGRVKRELKTIEEDTERESFDGLVGASPVMQAVYRMIDKVAASKASVFITGESGTGKDVVAQAIHARSTRADGPFVALNCGAIPKDLMESELFGHVRGAFTGATADRPGAARQAHGGTLFLDELGEMDINLQSKLLRFIQTGDVAPVGGNETANVDVRFVCATNRDPERAVIDGRLREDLFYRLNVLPLALPPLRKRGEDILLIAKAFLARFSAEEGRAFTGFTPDAAEILLAHAWPGNVRELQNVIRRAVVLNDADQVTAAMLPASLRDRAAAIRPGPAGISPVPMASKDEIRPLWLVEKETIEAAIARCGGNVNAAAARLEINPSTIYRKRQTWAALMDAAE